MSDPPNDRLAWMFKDAIFYPIGGIDTPMPKREVRLEVFNIIGTGRAEFNTFGYGEYTLDLNVCVLHFNHITNLYNSRLTTGTLRAAYQSGWTEYQNVLLVDVDLSLKHSNYYEGTLSFKWGDPAT